jgi:hypothetical protein
MPLQELEQLSGDGPSHAASDLARALAVGPATVGVGTGGGIVAQQS